MSRPLRRTKRSKLVPRFGIDESSPHTLRNVGCESTRYDNTARGITVYACTMALSSAERGQMFCVYDEGTELLVRVQRLRSDVRSKIVSYDDPLTVLSRAIENKDAISPPCGNGKSRICFSESRLMYTWIGLEESRLSRHEKIVTLFFLFLFLYFPTRYNSRIFSPTVERAASWICLIYGRYIIFPGCSEARDTHLGKK